MNHQIGDKLVTAHESVNNETFVEGINKSLMPYGDYIQIGIACLLAGIGVGFLIFSIIHYYKHTDKSVSIKKTKKRKHKLSWKYNLHLVKKGKRYRMIFSGPPKQHSDLVLRE